MSPDTQYNKNAAFGLTVDCLGAAIKGLVLYNILLLTGFWGYQDGLGAFRPLFYLLVIPLMILFAYIYAQWDGRTFVLLHIAVLLIWCSLSWFARSNRPAFLLTGIAAAAESIIYKYMVGDSDAKRHIKRFKLQKYYKWGVLLWLISLLLYIQPQAPSERFPLPLSVCAAYMTASFIVYLVLTVMMDYIFQQYDYFRQRRGTDHNTLRQLKHMNRIVVVILSILITLSMFGANETIVRLVSRIIGLSADLIIGSGIWGLVQITKGDYKDGAGLSLPNNGGRMDGPGSSLLSDRLFFAAGLIIVIILVPIVLLKLYKSIAANYEIGEDKAEYIPKYEEEKLRSSFGRPARGPQFGSDNNSRIRRIYYKIMNRRMDKNRMDIIHGKTPKELAGMYSKTSEQKKIQTLTRHYEKARYSDQLCTDDEVQAVKDIDLSQPQ